MSETEPTSKLGELLSDFPICMITTTDADGSLLAVPLAMQDHEFDGEIWFLVSTESAAMRRIDAHPRVGLSFSSHDSWVSVSGQARLTEEKDVVRELWDASVDAWFPDGPDDPRIRLLRVTADSAEYWDTPGSTVTSVLSFVKSRVTGTPAEIDNEKVDLD